MIKAIRLISWQPCMRGLLLVVTGLLILTRPVQAAELGNSAPAFTVKDLAGQSHRLSELRGRVIVLNYWATWCGPCKGELATLDRAYRMYRTRGLEVIAISTDRGVSAERLKRWTKDLALPVSLAEDHGDALYRPIGGALPSTYIIDRRGRIALRHAGAVASADFERTLASLLAEHSPWEP